MNKQVTIGIEVTDQKEFYEALMSTLMEKLKEYPSNEDQGYRVFAISMENEFQRVEQLEEELLELDY